MQLDVIFLDIDGVLNPDKANYKHVFAPDCVSQLKRILETKPDTHIVFSTTWRTGFTFFVLGWLWHQHELPLPRVIGRTPDIHTNRRGEEIQKWLEDAPQLAPQHKIRRYAVLDDEPEAIWNKIPRKNIFPCNPWDGLTENIADNVIQHFSKSV